MLTARYRSRVTRGAGGVSLRASGEQHAHVGKQIRHCIVPDIDIIYTIFACVYMYTHGKICIYLRYNLPFLEKPVNVNLYLEIFL